MKANYELKALRAKNNLSQQQMADLLKVTKTTYNRKENGLRKFTIEEAKSIADYFKLSIEDIFC